MGSEAVCELPKFLCSAFCSMSDSFSRIEASIAETMELDGCDMAGVERCQYERKALWASMVGTVEFARTSCLRRCEQTEVK